jgi:predicted TIM-barrel fold metal-dependent hydrolase
MVIDCSVHPVVTDEHYGETVGPPWNFRKFPKLLGDRYGAPFDQLDTSIEEASSPSALAGRVLQDVDYAILTPSARGYYPNPQQAAAVAGAANRLLHEEWLDEPEASGRYLGSIRVALNDAGVAVREIEKWADDDRFVQIVVPARALGTFGEQRFFPIWKAAAELGLVVYVHDDLGTLAEAPLTQVGYPSFFAEAHAVRPMAGIVQLTSLIIAGVFERLPNLRVVFGDVSVHAARSLVVRTDKDWRSDRLEVPWVTDEPTTYFERHVRFATQPEDQISPHGELAEGGIGGDSSALTVYGSRRPYWDSVEVDAVVPDWSADARERCLAGNALEFYPRLGQRVAIDAAAQ